LKRDQIQRVAIVVSELRVGGAERVIVHLACALANTGKDILVVCLQQPGELAQELFDRRIFFVALQSLCGYDLKAVWRLRLLLSDFSPDVINVHDRSSLPYVYLSTRIMQSIPVVFSAHGLLMRDKHPRLLDRLASHCLSGITAVSKQAAVEYARLMCWPHDVLIIDNGVPVGTRSSKLREQIRLKLGIGDDTTVYLAVGNTKPEKGFEDLIDAAAHIVWNGAPKSFVVLVAGGVSDHNYYAHLQKRIYERHLERCVQLLGFRRDVVALYSAADVFVLSSHKEGLPMVLLEAMSAGLPVVATRVGAVPTVIEDGVHGVLVDPADPAQLAEAMQAVAASTGSVAMSERGRKRILVQYGVGRMVKNYLRAYQEAAIGKKFNPVTLAGNPKGIGILHLGPQPPLIGGMATVVDNLFSSSLADRYQFIGMNTGKTTREGRSLWEAIWAQVCLVAQLISAVRKHKPKICHLHACEYFGYWRDCVHALIASLLGCRLVWHIHSGLFDQWCRNLPLLLKRLLRVSLEKAFAVVVLSHQFAENLRPFAPRANFRVVENGIPILARTSPLDKGPITVLFLGNWAPGKGVADLVQATSVAVRDLGFSGHVLLAGFEKDAGQRAKLDCLIAESCCASHIKILGSISGDRKLEALSSCHALVLPSYGEGLPMAILEAMEQGRTVIATRVGAIPELIRDGVDGFLMEPGDISTLAKYLALLDRDSNRLMKMGQSARQRVEKDYDLEVMAHRVLALYNSVLSGT
jgi:glycosyltransferase involved in cell wall biosynthesis